MKQSSATMLGAILAFVLLGGAFLAPRFFSSSSAAMNPTAQRLAEEAQRELSAYNEGVPRLLARQDVEAIKGADAEKLYARVAKDVDEQAEMIKQTIDRARQSDRASGMQGSLANAQSGAELIRKGVNDLQKLGSENDARLKAALKAANAAAAESRNSIGVGEVLGMTKTVEATDHLAEARRLRTRLNDETVDAVAVATEYVVIKTALDHYSGLSSKSADEALRGDSEEFEKLLSEGQQSLDELNKKLEERKSSLEGVKAGLASARSEMTNVEQQGFQPGNDSSYQSMKGSLESVSKRMIELQEQEQLLTFGGLKGANFADDEFATAKIDGGEEFLGIEELQRRQQVAADRVTRLSRGKEAIAKQIENVGVYGKSATEEVKRLTALLATKQGDFNKIYERMKSLNDQAKEKEDAAIKSAGEAKAAFGASQQAAQAFLSEIDEQRKYDSDGRNERLKIIKNDQLIRRIPGYAEAEANALLGRIYGERVLGLKAYNSTLERLTKVIKGSTYEPKEILEAIATARNEGTEALRKAKDAYANFASDPKMGWMSQISQAAISLAAAQIDTEKEAELRADAATAIRGATGKAGKSWLFNAHYQMLKDLVAPGEVSSAPATPEGDAKPAGDNGTTTSP